MNELDSGGVVFFCGAGISQGAGSELPGFAELVEYVYSKNDMLPDAVEREALDCDEEDPGRRRPSLDKALGLLERPERLGAQALRRTVIERLSRPPTGQLSVHKALIALSRSDQGIRLITTNFDDRFVETEEEIPIVDAASTPHDRLGRATATMIGCHRVDRVCLPLLRRGEIYIRC